MPLFKGIFCNLVPLFLKIILQKYIILAEKTSFRGKNEHIILFCFIN